MFANINLSHLKYFYDAAKNGSVSAAARENFVSQSAISQAIIRLEHALQVPLTTHQRQSLKLTEEGLIVFQEAKNIFVSVNGMKDRLNGLKGEVLGDIKFACTNALAQFFIPPAYLAMREQYPKVSLKFHRGSLKFIHEALRTSEVKFALVLDAPEFDHFDREIINRGNFQVYQKNGIKDGSGVFVDHVSNSEVIEFQRRYRERHGKELHIKEALSGWVMVSTFVQMGCGSGYLPEFVIKEAKDVKEVKLDVSPIQYAICMIKPKGTVLTKAENAFLDVMKAQK